MKCQIYFPVKKLQKVSKLSERELSHDAQISRACLRRIKNGTGNVTVGSIANLATYFGMHAEVILTSESALSEFSTVAVAYKVERDGFDSWKLHFMDLVDEFRRSLDVRLVILPPHSKFEKRLTALMASLVCHLCKELDIPPPPWSKKRYYLDFPWFISGIESLKAMALLESPLAFRSNNIFVHENFTDRV